MIDQQDKMAARRKTLLTTLAMIFVFIGVLWILYWLVWGKYEEYTDDAYVTGNLVALMPQVSGTIVSINTDDTHLVVQGQALIKLDEADKLVSLQHARANLALTVRQVRQYYEEVKQAQTSVTSQKADLDKALLDLNRRKDLVGQRAISREELQHYKTTVEIAQAQFDNAMHKLSSTAAIVENSHLYNHPLVESAKATFKDAYLNWVRTTIRAPVTGYVAKRNAQVGQRANMESALLAIVPLNEVWVEANFKENQLSRLRIGQDVELIADASNVAYHGKIVGLGAGTGSAFALLPPQNATGNWIKIVQRLPVRIAFDPDQLAQHPLQIGLSMRVTVYTRWLRGEKLSKKINAAPIYKTSIYNDQLAHADQEITSILEANAPDMQLALNKE